MANEFVARNGIFALNNSQVTGSLTVSNGITGSLFGTASAAQIANTIDFREADNLTNKPGTIPLFTQGLSFNDVVLTSATQTDGKILIGGAFIELNGVTRNYLVRLNSDGTVDTAFYTNLGTGFNSIVRSIAIQSDGKILVGGQFSDLNGTTRSRFVRLNSDGTVDTAFYTNLGTGFNALVYTVAVQSDGKIVIGGDFITLNGTTRKNLVRLNSDGTVDTSFYTNLGTGFNGSVLNVKIQSDGKILVGGYFSTLNGVTRNRFVRLNSDGTVDTTFYTNLGTGFNGGVVTIEVQSDGKILVGGAFTALNATTRNYLVRLNSDGTDDTAFYTNLGTGLSNVLKTISIQSDGKILVGGYFTQLNGNLRFYIVRLNSTGTDDTTFYTNLGSGFSSAIEYIGAQSDGRILVGGYFGSFNNNNMLGYFLRLTSQGLIDPTDYITSTTLKASSITQAIGGSITINSALNAGTIFNSTLYTGYLTNSGPYTSTYSFGTIGTSTTDQVMYTYGLGFYAAMIEIHVLMSDGSFRLTQLNIANDGNGNYTYTEQSTSDVGNTSPISLNVSYDSDNSFMQLTATNTSPNYSATLRAYVRLINA